MNRIIFNCPLRKKEAILSSIIAFALVSLLIYVIASRGQLLTIILPFVGVLALMISAIYMPIKLIITDKGIVIKSLLSSKKILFEDIIAIKERDSGWETDTRVFGSGGFLGYSGWFKNKSMGSYFAYVTDVKDSFWVISTKRTYLLSCDHYKEAVELISKKIE